MKGSGYVFKNFFKKDEPKFTIVDKSEVADNYVIIDNVVISSDGINDTGMIMINKYALKYESKGDSKKFNFNHIFNENNEIKYSATREHKYTIDGISFIRDIEDSDFLYSRAIEIIDKINILINKKLLKQKNKENNMLFHDEIKDYTFDILKINSVGRVYEGNNSIYYGLLEISGFEVNYDGTNMYGNTLTINMELSVLEPVKRIFSINDNNVTFIINGNGFFLQYNDINDSIKAWNKIDNYFADLDEISINRNNIINKKIDEIIDKVYVDFECVLRNYIIKSNLKSFLELHYLISLERVIKIETGLNCLNFYYNDVDEGIVESALTDENLEYSREYFNSHYVKMSNIISSKVDFDDVYELNLFVFKILKRASLDFFVKDFQNNLGFKIDDNSDVDTMVEVYFDYNKEIGIDLIDLGEFVNYLILNKGIDSNYIKSYIDIYSKLEVLSDRYELENYSNQLYEERVSQVVSIDDVDMMNGHEFEFFVSKLFSTMGYKTLVTKGSGDQGVDVIVEKRGTKIGIQSKCYSGNVGNSAIQEVVAGLTYYSLDKAMVITNSNFTKSAIELAKVNNVVLWDREVLKEKIDNYNIEL